MEEVVDDDGLLEMLLNGVRREIGDDGRDVVVLVVFRIVPSDNVPLN
jgi:hypothetical protein